MNQCKDQGNPPANRFLLLMGHLALATGPIVRMRANLIYENIQDVVKQEKYWKIQGVTEALRRVHNQQGQNMNECCRCWIGKVKGVEFPRKRCPDRCHNHSEVSASSFKSPPPCRHNFFPFGSSPQNFDIGNNQQRLEEKGYSKSQRHFRYLK